MLHVFTSPLFIQHNIKHGFFSRLGGFSSGVFNSLNCSIKSTDNPDHIQANLQKIAQSFGYEDHSLQLVHQDHTPKVVLARQNRQHEDLKKISADGIVSPNTNILLGTYTADCTPVLLYDYVKHIKAAIHVSWRTAANNILTNSLNMMQENGALPSNIIAAIGPAIQAPNYQVGDDVRQAFIQQHAQNSKYFTDDPAMANKYLFNLPQYCQEFLLAHGVSAVDNLHLDTYADEKHFFSFRRSTHQNRANGIMQPPKIGCQLSVIG